MINLSSSPVKVDDLSQGTLEQAEMLSPTKPFPASNASPGRSKHSTTITPAPNSAFKPIPHGLKYKHDVRKGASTLSSTGRRHSMSPPKAHSSTARSLHRTPLTTIKANNKTSKFDSLKNAKANLTGKLMQQNESDFVSSPLREDATVKLTMEKEKEENEEAEKQRNSIPKKHTATPGSEISSVSNREVGGANPETSPVRQYQSRLSHKRGSKEAIGSLSITDAKKTRIQSSPIARTPKKINGDPEINFRDHRQKMILRPTEQLSYPQDSADDEESNSPLANASRLSNLDKEDSYEGIQLDSVLTKSPLVLDAEEEISMNMPAHSALDVFNALMDEEEDEIQEDDIELSSSESSFYEASALDEIKEIQEKYEKSLNESNESLQKNIALLEQRTSELFETEANLKKLEVSFQKLSKESADLEALNKANVVKSSLLKSSLQNSKKELKCVSQKLELKEKRLSKYKDIYIRLFEHAKYIEKESNTQKAEITRLNSQINDLEDEKQKLIAAAEIAEKELLDSNKSLKVQTEELETANEKLAVEIIDKDRLSHELDDYKSQLEECKTRLFQFENQFDESKISSKNFSEEISKLKSVIEDCNTDIETLKEENCKIVLEIETTKTELVESKRLSEQSKADLEESEREKDELIKRFEELEREVAEEAKSRDDLLKDKNRQISEKDSLISDLSSKLAVLSGSEEKIRTLSSALEEARATIRGHASELTEQLDKLASQLYVQYSHKHEQKVAILKKGYESMWASKLKTLTKENEVLNSEIADLKRKLKAESEERERLIVTFGESIKN